MTDEFRSNPNVDKIMTSYTRKKLKQQDAVLAAAKAYRNAFKPGNTDVYYDRKHRLADLIAAVDALYPEASDD